VSANLKAMVLLIGIPLLFTAGALGLWAATNYHAFTKFQVVERVLVEPAEDDLFAGTGLFDGQDDKPAYRTVERDSFHFGLFPTPQGLFDKHMASVLTVSAPPWILAFGIFGFMVWRRRRGGLGNIVQQPTGNGDS